MKDSENSKIDLKWYHPDSFTVGPYKENLKTLKKLNLNTDSVFIDVGAHRGEELNYLKDIGCFVYSFECNPLHFENLENIYGSYEKIFLFNRLVTSPANGPVPVYFKNTSRGGSMSAIREKRSNNIKDFIYVDTISISDFISSLEHSKIDVIKLDVEGSEYKIIEDLIDSGKIEMVDLILFECHKHKIQSDEWQAHRKSVKLKMKKFDGPPSKFKKWT